MGGICKDNVEVVKVVVKQVRKDDTGVEYVVKDWNAQLTGGPLQKQWNKTFELINDFNSETGFKTLDVYAYDAKENFSNTRILIGVTSTISEVFLTYPRDVDMPGNKDFFSGPIADIAQFYKDNSSDNSENIKYYFNKTIEISGYTKAANPPDNSVTLKLFKDRTKSEEIYSHTIQGTVDDAKAKEVQLLGHSKLIQCS